MVVGRDRVVRKVKGRRPKNDEKIRLAEVKKIGLADKVILGHSSDMYFNIKKEKPDIIALGYDQTAFVEKLSDKLLELGLKNVKITRLRPYRPGIYKSSKLAR